MRLRFHSALLASFALLGCQPPTVLPPIGNSDASHGTDAPLATNMSCLLPNADTCPGGSRCSLNDACGTVCVCDAQTLVAACTSSAHCDAGADTSVTNPVCGVLPCESGQLCVRPCCLGPDCVAPSPFCINPPLGCSADSGVSCDCLPASLCGSNALCEGTSRTEVQCLCLPPTVDAGAHD